MIKFQLKKVVTFFFLQTGFLKLELLLMVETTLGFLKPMAASLLTMSLLDLT